MTTVSTVRLEEQLRDRIIGFTTPDGHSVATVLGSGESARLYWNQAPENVTTPYVVARLINQQVSLQGSRLRADLELMVFDRPRSTQVEAEHLTDWIQGSLIGYRSAASGLLIVNPPSARDSLPAVPEPGDSDLVQIRLVHEVIAFPAFLKQYATPGS